MNTSAYECEYLMKRRAHVVILGAGASCAVIPKGDKYGKKISAMASFIEKLGLSDIIFQVDIHTKSDNLEDIYMEWDERSTKCGYSVPKSDVGVVAFKADHKREN
jgi:hypothetical protein